MVICEYHYIEYLYPLASTLSAFENNLAKLVDFIVERTAINVVVVALALSSNIRNDT